MARKDVFKGTLDNLINNPAAPARPHGTKSILQSGALGAVDAGLGRGLQLSELDPATIQGSTFEDRLPWTETDIADLVASIRDNGQQIPILVQRLGPDSYQVIYGRRRLAAARALGIKVRALVTLMDNDQRIIAQGVENSVRRDLSFIEKALFGHRLREAGTDDATIRFALNIDVGAPKATTLSTMKMVIDTLGEPLILEIGRAPGIGRPRWRSLADLYREKAGFADVNHARLAEVIRAAAPGDATEEDPSDLRFKVLFTFLSSLGTDLHDAVKAVDSHEVTDGEKLLGVVRRSPQALTFSFAAKADPAYHAWLNDHAEALIRELHHRWTTETDMEKEAR